MSKTNTIVSIQDKQNPKSASNDDMNKMMKVPWIYPSLVRLDYPTKPEPAVAVL